MRFKTQLRYQFRTQNKVRVLYLHLRVVNRGNWARAASASCAAASDAAQPLATLAHLFARARPLELDFCAESTLRGIATATGCAGLVVQLCQKMVRTTTPQNPKPLELGAKLLCKWRDQGIKACEVIERRQQDDSGAWLYCGQ